MSTASAKTSENHKKGTAKAVPFGVLGYSYVLFVPDETFGLEAALLHHRLGDLLEAGNVGASHQIVTQTVLLGGLGGHLVDVLHHLVQLVVARSSAPSPERRRPRRRR